MVGVEECVSDDGPGLIPWKILIVDEDAHQFGDGKGGVSLCSE